MATKPLPVHGADISHHQSSVDLAKAQKAGLDWLYHKCTQGKGFVDKRYVERRNLARKLGLPFGAYHFAETTSSPEVQAAHFLKTAGIKPGDMRPMLDVEDYAPGKSFFSKMSVKARSEWVGKFVAIVEEATGVKPFIYTPFDFNKTFGCPLWVARYSNVNAEPNIPKPWKSATVRQFTNGVFGVPKSFSGLGNVDLNCWVGDPAKLLKQYVIPKPVATTPAPAPVKKTVAELAAEVVAGKWSTGAKRVAALKAAGYDPEAVQKEVNALLVRPPKRRSATLRVSTANVQNFPDMTDANVRADVKLALSVSDLVLWQEIGEAADHKAINDLDEGFATTQIQRETPITGRLGVLRPVGAPRQTMISEGLGKGSFSPPRWMTEQEYEWTIPTDLPNLWSINIHYIQAAWGSRPVTRRPERQAHWNKGHKVHGQHALAALKKGFIVIGGGDWNRGTKDIPKFTEDQKWVIAGTGLDHVYVLVPKAVRLVAGAMVERDLKSDHPLRTARVTLAL